mmetsp:Transcript_28815/g.58890  ORF Transcript_28815/g.58890 Transcript_28815/m.58890 type:complete len:219 (-) Transcript_28815:1116-1772(-)
MPRSWVTGTWPWTAVKMSQRGFKLRTAKHTSSALLGKLLGELLGVEEDTGARGVSNCFASPPLPTACGDGGDSGDEDDGGDEEGVSDDACRCIRWREGSEGSRGKGLVALDDSTASLLAPPLATATPSFSTSMSSRPLSLSDPLSSSITTTVRFEGDSASNLDWSWPSWPWPSRPWSSFSLSLVATQRSTLFTTTRSAYAICDSTSSRPPRAAFTTSS